MIKSKTRQLLSSGSCNSAARICLAQPEAEFSPGSDWIAGISPFEALLTLLQFGSLGSFRFPWWSVASQGR